MYITNRNNFFDDQAIADAVDHAKEMFPLESCGAIIDEEYVRFENRAEDKAKSFVIDDPEFDLAYQNNEVQAVIHSHDNYRMASKADQQQQIEFDIPFGVINLLNRSVTHVIFWGDSLPIEPLKRRFFFYGVWDCYALVRDYFRVKWNHTLPNVARDFGFWNENKSVFEPNMEQDGFDVIPVHLDDIQPNDILLYNIHGTTYINHCAVLQENGLVLQHFQNEVSREYPISYFQQYLHSACRLNLEVSK